MAHSSNGTVWIKAEKRLASSSAASRSSPAINTERPSLGDGSPAHRQSRAGRVIFSVLPEKLAYESARPNEEASPRHLVPALDGGLPGDWRRRLALSPDASCSRSLVKTGGGDHAHRREIFLEVAGRDSRRPTVILTAGRFARLSNKLAIFSSYSPHQAENSPLK